MWFRDEHLRHPVDTPKLVLATPFGEWRFDTRYVAELGGFLDRPVGRRHAEPRTWETLRSTPASVGGGALTLWATELQPTEPMQRLLPEFAFPFAEPCIPSLDEIMRYQRWLADNIGVHCNESFRHLRAGIYPIDASTENLRRVCVDRLPDDLDDLFRWSRRDRPVERERWVVFILGAGERVGEDPSGGH